MSCLVMFSLPNPSVSIKSVAVMTVMSKTILFLTETKWYETKLNLSFRKLGFNQFSSSSSVAEYSTREY